MFNRLRSTIVKKWQELVSLIQKRILEQPIKEGDRLPSDRQLAREFGCSLQPVLRAMESLARKGIVQRRAGAATIVLSTPPFIDDLEYSFSRACTDTHGHALETRLIEKTRRLPLPGANEAVERRAQKALGLRIAEPFLVIARLRLLDNRPRVLHRVFLKPAHFPDSLLLDFDFVTDSLIDVYRGNGYQIEARHTTLRARWLRKEELLLFNCRQQPVLESEQKTEAVRRTSGEIVALEYLHATYVDWDYQISNRRSPRGEE